MAVMVFAGLIREEVDADGEEDISDPDTEAIRSFDFEPFQRKPERWQRTVQLDEIDLELGTCTVIEGDDVVFTVSVEEFFRLINDTHETWRIECSNESKDAEETVRVQALVHKIREGDSREVERGCEPPNRAFRDLGVIRL